MVELIRCNLVVHESELHVSLSNRFVRRVVVGQFYTSPIKHTCTCPFKFKFS